MTVGEVYIALIDILSVVETHIICDYLSHFHSIFLMMVIFRSQNKLLNDTSQITNIDLKTATGAFKRFCIHLIVNLRT